MIISLDSVDFEKDYLEDILDLITKRLEAAYSNIDWSHPELCDLFDPMEHLAGIGSVAVQRYIASVCNFASAPREQALQLGPQRKGQPIALVLNSAANCWKHAEDLEPIRQTTKAPLLAIGVNPDASYFVTNSLYEMGYKHYSGLMPDLINWRDFVYEKYIKQK